MSTIKIRNTSEFFCRHENEKKEKRRKQTTISYITIRIKSQLVQYQSDLRGTKKKKE